MQRFIGIIEINEGHSPNRQYSFPGSVITWERWEHWERCFESIRGRKEFTVYAGLGLLSGW